MGLGMATSQYDAKGRATVYGSDERFLQLVTGFEGRWGLWPDLELGWKAPVIFIVFGSTVPGSVRVSGGGLGDVSAWIKFRWLNEAGVSSAVWLGGKWPTGKGMGLDPLKLGTDQTGTATQDGLAGLAVKWQMIGLSWYFNASYALTGPKSFTDAVGTAIEQDDGDMTSLILAARFALASQADLTLPVVFENANRARQNGVSVDDTAIQWLAFRPSLQLRATPEVVIEPSVEYPLRGVNRRKEITFQLNFRYEY
jgi:hypothetical protein